MPVQANPGRGKWTRWGRGMCEGWSLEIGMALHGSVVRRDNRGEPPKWVASINSTALGEFLEREIAMHRVEELVETSMTLVLHDWELYLETKAKRQCAVECAYHPIIRKSKSV
jgi:hypothetical protein